MLDHILQGRFIMGISRVGSCRTPEVFGNLQKNRNAMFVEAINMVLDIWGGEAPYDLQGEFFQVTTRQTMLAEIGQGSILKPYQRPHPRIVGTAVAPFSQGVTEMAKRGWQAISANFLLPQWVKTHWSKYVEGRQAVGAVACPSEGDRQMHLRCRRRKRRAALRSRYRRAVPLLLQATHEKSWWAMAAANLFKADQQQPDSEITPEYVTNKLVIAGGVDSVVDQLLAFRQQVGDFGTLLYACHDWVDPVLGKRSMELMAEQVMPRVNAAIAAEGQPRVTEAVA